eukprot:6173312-Pleurochrysis_carterae.AAC.1
MTPGERSEAFEAYAITKHIDSLEAQAAAEISEAERLKRLITDADNKLAEFDPDDKQKMRAFSLESVAYAGQKPLTGQCRAAESPAASPRDAFLTDGERADGPPADAAL